MVVVNVSSDVGESGVALVEGRPEGPAMMDTVPHPGIDRGRKVDQSRPTSEGETTTLWELVRPHSRRKSTRHEEERKGEEGREGGREGRRALKLNKLEARPRSPSRPYSHPTDQASCTSIPLVVQFHLLHPFHPLSTNTRAPLPTSNLSRRGGVNV